MKEEIKSYDSKLVPKEKNIRRTNLILHILIILAGILPLYALWIDVTVPPATASGRWFGDILSISVKFIIFVSILIYINKLHLRHIASVKLYTKNPNQQVDPIVTTPVDEVEAQFTQGHP